MTANPFSQTTFFRTAARRAANLPTVTVLVGSPGAARRVWRHWCESTGTPILECPTEPLQCLREWALLRRDDLTRAIHEHLGLRTGRNQEGLNRDWSHKTNADKEDFWKAVSPEPGDDVIRRALSPDHADFPEAASMLRLLDSELPGFHWPALLATVADPAMLAAWGDLAQKHPKLPLTVAVPATVWEAFLASTGESRNKTILLEGEVRLPHLEPEDVARELLAGGIPPKMAAALAKDGGDQGFIEATLKLYQATAAKPVSESEDTQARSAAEQYLYDRLENLVETSGKFELNANLDFRFGNKLVEIDLLCTNPKVAIEIDGYFHFRGDDDYRRDRDKDWVLQKEGYLVLRFLAEDVTRHWDAIRDRILEAMQRSSL